MLGKNIAHPQSPKEAFHLFVTQHMLQEILLNINRKAPDIQRNRNIRHMDPFSHEEMLACLGVIMHSCRR